MMRRCLQLRSLLTVCLPNIRTQLMPEVLTTSSRKFSDKQVLTANKPDWNRAILEAEKIVGYPNLFLSLQSLPGDDLLSIAGEIRKLVGTSHPLLKITKRLIYNGRNNMQIRGLIILLSAKLTGTVINGSTAGHEHNSEISSSQQCLAEVTEMIHTARLIHKGVVNLSGLEPNNGGHVKDIEFGNKIAILVGDYFLANASLRLGSLKNTEVVEMMALAIRNFVEGEFIFDQDQHGSSYPLATSTIHDWEIRTYLCSGSLLAHGCRSAALLAAHNESIQNQIFEFGKQLGLTWQAFNDLQVFTDELRHPPGTAFDLTSSPMILHLQNNPSILDMIVTHQDDLSDIDYKKIYSVLTSGSALQETRLLCQKYAKDAVKLLHQFPNSDARLALENIIYAMEG